MSSAAIYTFKKHNVLYRSWSVTHYLYKYVCWTSSKSVYATHITIIVLYNENRTHYFHKVNENPKDCVVFAIGYINFSKTLI